MEAKPSSRGGKELSPPSTVNHITAFSPEPQRPRHRLLKSSFNKSLNDIDPSRESLTQLLHKALAELRLDPSRSGFRREDIVAIAHNMGLLMSPSQSVEAFLQMSAISEEGSYSESPQFEGLLLWFTNNVHILRSLEKRQTARSSHGS